MRVLEPPTTIARDRARALRQASTTPEVRLWRALRSRSLHHAKVRRQVPLGPFILDFAIASARLAIEVDGENHAVGDGPARDARRDDWLAAQGWRVLRFTNSEVMTNLDGVLAAIVMALATKHPHPGPLPTGEGAG